MGDRRPTELLGKLTNPRRVARALRARGSVLRTRAERKWRVLSNPISTSAVRRALGELTGGGTDTLMVHSSLSAVGSFPQGLEALTGALAGHCAMLCMPTHTYCYPTVEEEAPLFDPASTPAQTGLLCDFFWRRPGVVRSIHATHSIAASGPQADELCRGHYLADSPCGRGTPFMRLVERRASALMFGVSFKFYTLFHTAEFDAESEVAYQHGVRDRLRVIDETGGVRETSSYRQNWALTRYEEAGLAMERLGLVRRRKLGAGLLLYCPDVSKVHDWAVERLRKTPDFLRASCTVELR